mmetsp:Transcript_73099/g.236453  ORF Transcript_73099/g.236453 Transcript_73099/m.236453 type:complete len:309 (+) Transcript_73099:421-1347(+)
MARNSPEHTTPTPYILQRPARRDATFTGSPMHPKRILVTQPMLPVSTSPEFRPMRTLSCGSARARSSAFSACTARCCASAARQACPGWSSTGSGVFHTANRPSCSTSDTTPSYSSMTSVILVKYKVSRTTISSSESCSVILVKSRISENMIVTLPFFTWSRVARSSPLTMFLTTASGTKCPKDSTPFESWANSSCNTAISWTRERLPETSSWNSTDVCENLSLESFRRSLLSRVNGWAMRSPTQTDKHKLMTVMMPKVRQLFKVRLLMANSMSVLIFWALLATFSAASKAFLLQAPACKTNTTSQRVS